MQHYQQLDLQTLIDLLAKETEQYTKAFISGKQQALAVHKIAIDALVVEITRRKKAEIKPPDQDKTPPLQNDSIELPS
jgi:hypothetical protein